MQDAITEALTVDRGSFEPQPARDPFVAMQRVVVRMLVDPAFAERVDKTPDDALAGLPTDAALTAQPIANFDPSRPEPQPEPRPSRTAAPPQRKRKRKR